MKVRQRLVVKEDAKADPSYRAGWPFDLTLTAILVLATVVRLYVWWQAPRLGFVADEAEYYQGASVLADGRGWAFFDTFLWVRPPLYPLMLAGLLRWLDPGLAAVRVVQIILSVGTVYLLYRLALRTAGRRVGLIAAGLAAVAWPFAVLSYLLLSETLFLFLFLLSINLLSAFLASSPNSFPATPSGFLPAFIRRPTFLLILAGFCLGLSALTRGQVLSFMPLIGVWLWFGLGRQWRRAGFAFGIVAAIFVVTVAPWAGRNYTVFGRPLIDTTGGYNFYVGALHGKNEAQVINALSEVSNQADREGLAYRKGFEILFKDPADWLGKSFKESLDFWRLNFGAEERLEKSYTKGAISPAWLLPDQLLGDLLYIVTGGLALLGLPLLPRRGGLRSFIVLWLAYNLALAFAFFAVSRFRLPVYFFWLIPAAYVLANPRLVWQSLQTPLRLAGRSLSRGGLALLILPGLFLLLVLPSWSPDQAVLGGQEWRKAQNSVRGDDLRRQGRYDEALRAYAGANPTAPATGLGVGLTLALQGHLDEALARLQEVSPDVPQSHLALGWLYLRRGQADYAHSEFRTRSLSLDSTATEWAWANLPTAPLPNNELKIGELDWGYVGGFQPYERENAASPPFRWTAGRGESGQDRARLRFPLTVGTSLHHVTLYLNGYRPPGLASPSVEVFANGRSLGRLQTTNGWQSYTLSLPTDLTPGPTLIVELAPSSTFVPGAASRRELGVMLQWASLD